MEELETDAEIKLEHAEAKDVDIFLALERKVAGSRLYSPTVERSDLIHDIATSTAYIIKKNGIPVGSVMYEDIEPNRAYISYVVVDPEYQGGGIARKAVGKVLEILKGKQYIDLVVHPENAKAVGLYQSFGFEVQSRQENYYGDGEPRLIMMKQNF